MYPALTSLRSPRPQIVLLANLADLYRAAGNVGAASQCLLRGARIRAPAADADGRAGAKALDAALSAAKDGDFSGVEGLASDAATKHAAALHAHTQTGVTALMLAAAASKCVAMLRVCVVLLLLLHRQHTTPRMRGVPAASGHSHAPTCIGGG